MPGHVHIYQRLVQVCCVFGQILLLCYIQQYLKVVRILHLENGFDNPLTNNFHPNSVLLGIKRKKGNYAHFKHPLSP